MLFGKSELVKVIAKSKIWRFEGDEPAMNEKSEPCDAVKMRALRKGSQGDHEDVVKIFPFRQS